MNEVDLIHQVQSALSGRFGEIATVGEGGMATVFRARDLGTDEIVALKVFRPELSSAVNEARFRQESEISSGLEHPNIVPVLGAGTADNLLYFIMPFVEGDTLRDRILSDGPLSVEGALRMIREVGAGLAHAHEAGFLHRDIKPSNIILSPSGAVLTDFGVAMALKSAGGPRLTRSGFSVGTPMYMSPEQGAGDTGLDVRSDEYSLACVLYEALVGEPPFTGPTSVVVVARHIGDAPPSLAVARPGLPAGVVDAVNRALSKTPADRFDGIPAFLEALTKEAPARPAASPLWWGRVGLGALAVTVLIWGMAILTSGPDLEHTSVLVFPPDAPDGGAGLGDQVATYIGYVLEGTDPLVWKEGRDWLDGDTRIEDLSHADRLSLARQAGAGYFIDGSILQWPDSVTVVLRLFDAATDDLVQRSGRSDEAGANASRLGARAMVELLGPIIEPGRVVDLGSLADRSPVAIARFHQGEVAYRRSRFAEALDQYEEAVAADPIFALAAVKGAQAAHWLEDATTASALAAIAIGQDSLLPARYRSLARGIAHKHAGRADSALVHFGALRQQFPDWAEAAAGEGEVYYHLLPTSTGLDSLARSGFEAAVRLDSNFTPPLYHLTEMAIRAGELDAARSNIELLEAADPDKNISLQLQIMIECAASGPEAIEWEELANTAAYSVLSAAQAMGSSRSLRGCGLAASMAVLIPGTARQWGAFLVYHSLLVADQRTNDLMALMGSERVAGLPTHTVLMLDAIADPNLTVIADSVYQSRQDSDEYITSPTLWLMMHWARTRGYVGDIREMAGVLIERRPSGSRADTLFAEIGESHLALANGQLPEAIEMLRSLRPTGTVQGLVWDPWEALVLERLLLAELLIETGDSGAAREVLSAVASHRSVMEGWLSPERQRLLDLAESETKAH